VRILASSRHNSTYHTRYLVTPLPYAKNICSSHVWKFRSSTLIAGQVRSCSLRLEGAFQAPTGCIVKRYIYSKDTSTFSPNKRREHRTGQVNPSNPFIMQVKHFVGIFIISVGLGQALALPSNHSSLLIKRRACAFEEIQNRDPGVNPISCTFDCGIGKFALLDQVGIHSDPPPPHGTQRDRAGKLQRQSSYRPVLMTSILTVRWPATTFVMGNPTSNRATTTTWNAL
jgi:hypothetical protein